ncbi:elongation factor P [Patescibacteria group bacterium]|nr:elongation factor P [Patescibacteria group bacterium]
MPLTNQPVKGMYILEENKIYYILDRQLKTQGRQGGLIIMRLQSMETGNQSTKTIKSGAKVEHIEPETKEMQYLYSDGSGSYFMDSETYETINIPKDTIGDYVNFLKEGMSTLVLMYNGKILNIKEVPNVVLKVTETSDAVKGNTANSATKLAKVETGFELQVPMFIKVGDDIKISTESGSYSGKSN